MKTKVEKRLLELSSSAGPKRNVAVKRKSAPETIELPLAPNVTLKFPLDSGQHVQDGLADDGARSPARRVSARGQNQQALLHGRDRGDAGSMANSHGQQPKQAPRRPGSAGRAGEVDRVPGIIAGSTNPRPARLISIACQPRRNGSTRVGQGRRRSVFSEATSASCLSTAGSRTIRPARRIRSASCCPTLGGCTTCSGTCGSGPPTGIPKHITRQARTSTRKALLPVTIAAPMGARLTTPQVFAARHAATTGHQPTSTRISASAWSASPPAVSRRPPQTLWPDGQRPLARASPSQRSREADAGPGRLAGPD